jgi:hypothetical protein
MLVLMGEAVDLLAQTGEADSNGERDRRRTVRPREIC